MIITSLHINAFGKFIDKTINFTDGLNVIYGENEAGKSTTHAFIRAMLFGIKKKKGKLSTDTFQKYFPWDTKNKYGGSLNLIYKENTYSIIREFSLTNPVFKIINISQDNKEIENPDLFLNKILHNINSDTFDNTISIGQLKSAQDVTIIDELHKIISNLNTSGDIAIDTLYAINLLSHKKKELQDNINKDATIQYNKELGNIRALEKELQNQKYENKLPSLISKRNAEAKIIKSNSIELEDLKKESAEKALMLSKFGLNDIKDINSLSNEVNKIYFDYKPIMKEASKKYGPFVNIFTMSIGILMIVVSSMLLVATYPDIASILNLHNTKYSMNLITNFIIQLPFHPIILIGLLICLGMIFLLFSIILLINNIKSKSSSVELKNILSDILNQHIGTDEVNDDTIQKFKKHIRDMKLAAKTLDSNEARIIILAEENNLLLKKQAEYTDDIKSQQKIQYDVEQKYNELYKLRIDNEKTKKTLQNNDLINMDIESLNLAIETIKSLSNEIQVSFGTHLNDTASKYLKILTNNKYTSINVDNTLKVTINYEGRNISLSDTSTGTIDQIYLALRLAISDIINKSDNILPLIFDDCFAMYDNKRLESTLNFLANINTQILVFTCHTREKEIVKYDGIKANTLNINTI